MPNRNLVLGFCFAVTLSLGGGLMSAHEAWTARGDHSGGVLTRLFGDGRRMFANHFFKKADAYFHRGYYPSIFEEKPVGDEAHMQQDAHGEGDHEAHEEDHEHEAGHALHAPPRDWIERLNRQTVPTEHVELAGAEAREILPWLRISAELDPHRIETYTVAAYWLRAQMGKPREAEQFLREGLQANPDSYEILFELGRLIELNHKDLPHACNVYELAVRRWDATEAGKPKPDMLGLGRILVAQARAEEARGELTRALNCLERLEPVSPNPGEIQKQITELRSRVNGPKP